MRFYCKKCNIVFQDFFEEKICPICKSSDNIIRIKQQPKIEKIQYKIRKRCDTCKLDRKYLETLEIREINLINEYIPPGCTVYFPPDSLEDKKYIYIRKIKNNILEIINQCPDCDGTGYVEEWR